MSLGSLIMEHMLPAMSAALRFTSAVRSPFMPRCSTGTCGVPNKMVVVMMVQPCNH